MIRRYLAQFFGAVALPVLVGCASTSPKAAFGDVAQAVEQQSGFRVQWDQNTTEDAAVARSIDQLLSHELHVERAVQIALLSSPVLRAKFEELSIAQADLVQAGLLSNPVVTLGRTAWETEHIDPNLFGVVEQDFLDLLTMPMRKRVAASELEMRKLEVADAVLALVADVRSAFFVAQAAEQVAHMRRLVHEAAEASAEIARRQHTAGNINDLTLAAELGLAAQANLDRKRAVGASTVAREHLVKIMGLWGHRTNFRLTPKLPELPPREVPLTRLESTAIAHRLDIAAMRREVQSLDYGLSLAKGSRWTGMIRVQVEAGRLRESKRLSFGPSVALEIPLFDQRQAAIARLEAYHRQAQDRLYGLSIEVRSDVRVAQARVVTARSVVEEYGQVLVPLRENIVRYSQQHYDAMLLGVHQLLQAKQAEFESYREYIESLRDYWIARSDLERAVGTRLLSVTSDTKAPTATPAKPAVPSKTGPTAVPSSTTPPATHVH